MSRYSTIGSEQVKQTSLRHKAAHYRRMALAIQTNTLARHTFPKSIPRGNAPEWYRTRAHIFERQAEIAGALAEALVDAQHHEWLETRTPEEAAMWIDRGLEGIGGFVEHLRQDWPTLGTKLSVDQRTHVQAQVQVMMGWLMQALEGQ